MRALIMTFGTRGDIQPYAALAGALSRSGHDVTLAIPRGMSDLVPEAGSGRIDVVAAGSAMLRAVQELLPEMSGVRDASRSLRIMRDAMRQHLDETRRAAEAGSPDIIVYHPKCLGGPHLAEMLGIPGVLSLPLPFYTPTGEFPAPFFGGASFGRRGNRATYAVGRASSVMYAGMIRDFRRQLGLAGDFGRFTNPLVNPDGTAVHVLYPYSRHVVPVPADYPPTAHVTGYWFLDAPESRLSDDVQRFLDAGDAPVYVGFGSMGFGKGAEQRRDAVLEAFARTGLRGIVATGWGGIAPGDAPSDDVLMIEGAPHEVLFPRCSAVVHHGGAGSTAAGLRAGKPSLVVPFLGDQPFWGSRVHALGAGPSPVPPKRLARDFAGRLAQLVGAPNYARRAIEVGDRIRAEDGLAEGVRVLERLAE